MYQQTAAALVKETASVTSGKIQTEILVHDHGEHSVLKGMVIEMRFCIQQVGPTLKDQETRRSTTLATSLASDGLAAA